MTKKIILLLFVLLATPYGVISSHAQQRSTTNSTDVSSRTQKKTLRKYRQAKNNALVSISIENMIRTKNFTFDPYTLQSTPRMVYQNVQLDASYYVTVNPSTLYVVLPIYGGNLRTGTPSLGKELDFFTSNYTYTYEKNEKTGYWRVVVKAMDTWSFNTFTFEFDISPRSNADMSLSTDFVGPAYFTGNITSN